MSYCCPETRQRADTNCGVGGNSKLCRHGSHSHSSNPNSSGSGRIFGSGHQLRYLPQRRLPDWFQVSGAFERRRYLNVVVHKSRHPELRDYIHSSVNGLLPFIQKGEVERVAVNFFDNQNVPIERFVFKIDVKQSYGSSVEEEGAAAAADLELSFRSFLIKLASSYSLTHTLPPDCRWEITGYFRALPDSRSSASRIWVSTGTKQWQQPPVIMPIKSMKSEALVLQLYLEHPPTPLHQNFSLS